MTWCDNILTEDILIDYGDCILIAIALLYFLNEYSFFCEIHSILPIVIIKEVIDM